MLGLEKVKPVKPPKKKKKNTKPEPEEIIEILQHKKYRNGKIKIKVKCNNGDEEWCDNAPLKKIFHL